MTVFFKHPHRNYFRKEGLEVQFPPQNYLIHYYSERQSDFAKNTPPHLLTTHMLTLFKAFDVQLF